MMRKWSEVKEIEINKEGADEDKKLNEERKAKKT